MAKTRGKRALFCHTPDDHLWAATTWPDGHLCQNPEEKSPNPGTLLMAIYGEMVIYGVDAHLWQRRIKKGHGSALCHWRVESQRHRVASQSRAPRDGENAVGGQLRPHPHLRYVQAAVIRCRRIAKSLRRGEHSHRFSRSPAQTLPTRPFSPRAMAGGQPLRVSVDEGQQRARSAG